MQLIKYWCFSKELINFEKWQFRTKRRWTKWLAVKRPFLFIHIICKKCFFSWIWCLGYLIGCCLQRPETRLSKFWWAKMVFVEETKTSDTKTNIFTDNLDEQMPKAATMWIGYNSLTKTRRVNCIYKFRNFV